MHTRDDRRETIDGKRVPRRANSWGSAGLSTSGASLPVYRLSSIDITCALFDIDGTLFDTERLWAEALSLVFEDLGCRQSPRRLTELTYGLAWPDADAALRGAHRGR